ncbi:unnamed protein product [Phytophthora fragariaefolia]|uniref:Unnamed protein product n=1 Tax=Phytophthora fragariaefolia TaxID=1490495 RepID=A0A9W6WWM3_9STRA|nr:unnamed protein product [Phytophthora fragariaefolia]
MSPTWFWALKDRKDPARIVKLTEHKGYMADVLTIRRDGKIGGGIKRDELPTYPPGYCYTVQEHGWMDATGWKYFVQNLLKYAFDGPLPFNNFDCHVSEEKHRVVAEKANATVVPLQPNTTAVCQPLDVGVMGPLKAKFRAKFRGVSGGTATEKRLRAIKSTIAVWKELEETTVFRSFEKAIPRYSEVMV